MPSNFHVFDHSAKYLAQLDAPTTPRSWILNGFGKAEFTVDLNYLTTRFSPKEESIMQYNNLVYIEHVPTRDASNNSNGKLPPWAGIILPDRTWEQFKLGANAYSAEAILTFRPMPLTTIKGTPKAMFLQILEFARGATENIVIHPGIVEDIPQTFSDNLTTSAYDHIKKLCANSGMNWDVTAEIDSRNNLQLYANLYRFKGSDTTLILNSDNTENAAPLLTEQGTPYNVVCGFSQANTKESRYSARGINQESVDKYGVLATNHTFSGITDQAGLQSAAQSMADASPPYKIVRRVVLDHGSAFNYMQVGNIVTIKDTTVGFKPGGGFGFEASARILSVDYNDLSNKVPLHLEII